VEREREKEREQRLDDVMERRRFASWREKMQK